MAAALFLTGVAPSFADDSKGQQMSPSVRISSKDAPSVEGTSAILMDAGSGEILYEKNAREKRDPASVTKIVTCLVVLETMDMDEEVTAAVTFDPSTGGVGIKIKKGEVFTVEQLLYALMLSSANDAAEVLAIASGGSIENFCELMNERAKRCGAIDTGFSNPSGLNGEGYGSNVTTAYDLALISIEAMKNKEFRKIVSTVEYSIPATNMSGAREFINVNRCISDGETTLENAEKPTDGKSFRYEGCLGIKTGYTRAAGNCFSGWAVKEDTELSAVIMNSSSYTSRFEDVISLWDYGFKNYYTYNVVSAGEMVGEVEIKRGEKGSVFVSVNDDLDITLNREYKSKGITTEIIPAEEKIKAPVKKGDEVGSIMVYKDEKPVAEAPVYAVSDVGKGGILSYIGMPDDKVPMFIIGFVIAVIILLILVRMYRVNKYRKRMRKRAQINRNARRREWEKERNPFDRY